MAIKKIQMRPEGTNDYADVLHPETSADMVKFADGSTVESHKAERATLDKLGHVKAETTEDGTLIIPKPDVPKSNYNANRPPNKEDDETQGYSVGSRWLRPAYQQEWVCMKSTAGAAFWACTSKAKKLSIYTQGTEHFPIVQGYVSNQERAIIEKRENNIYIKSTLSVVGQRSTVVTDEKITLSDISTLYIEWEGVGNGFQFFISEDKMKPRGDMAPIIGVLELEDSFARKISELDVAHLQGDYYIHAQAESFSTNANGVITELIIHNIYGEG